jgi:hypothetical protein
MPKETMKDPTVTVQESDDPTIPFRWAKVAEFLSKGWSQSDIAKNLRVSESTISRDIQTLRDEAVKGISDYLENFPLEFEKARNGLNTLLKRAWELLEKADGPEQSDLIKLIADLNDSRLRLHANPEMLHKAAKYSLQLKEELARFKKSAPKWEPTTETTRAKRFANGKRRTKSKSWFDRSLKVAMSQQTELIFKFATHAFFLHTTNSTIVFTIRTFAL